MRTVRTVLTVAALAALAFPAAAGAQQTEPTPAPPPSTLDTGVAAPSPRRARLEAQLRERTAQVVRQQLQLTDDQFAQLQRVNQKYQQPQRELTERERYLRLSLRAELALGTGADQSKVNDYLDQLAQVQQSRLQIFRDEQHDLGGFLSPVQRAKYAALQEQIRKRLTQMRQQQLDRRPHAGGGRGIAPRRPRD
jgi:Spy/CpxP family protein refolding chaperone